MVSLFKKLSLLILVVAILIVLLFNTTKYVCYDGTIEKDDANCPILPNPKVLQRQAENAVDTYASAYASALGARHSRVNTYRQDGHWQSEILLTSTKTGTVRHVTLKVDGTTSSVSCVEGCDYLLKEDEIIENSTQNITNDDFEADFTIY